MKFQNLPAGCEFWDVDGIAVVGLPGTRECVAFSDGKGLDVDSRPFPNPTKARNHGDALTRGEFETWLKTGKNKFDI